MHICPIPEPFPLNSKQTDGVSQCFAVGIIILDAEINLEVELSSVQFAGTEFTDYQGQGWNLYDPTINIVGQ